MRKESHGSSTFIWDTIIHYYEMDVEMRSRDVELLSLFFYKFICQTPNLSTFFIHRRRKPFDKTGAYYIMYHSQICSVYVIDLL